MSRKTVQLNPARLVNRVSFPLQFPETRNQCDAPGCSEPVMLTLCLCVGERYVPGVGQVEPCDEVRREIIHQLSIRPMAHSELVKALPENVRNLSVCLSALLSVHLSLDLSVSPGKQGDGSGVCH